MAKRYYAKRRYNPEMSIGGLNLKFSLPVKGREAYECQVWREGELLSTYKSETPEGLDVKIVADYEDQILRSPRAAK